MFKDIWYGVRNFIRNVWNYRKFLWKNSWWDSHYIFYMLREKLKEDVKCYKKHGHHLYVQNEIDEMEFCIKLLNRIIENDYLENALIPFEKKYPEYMDAPVSDWLSDWEEIKENMFRRCSNRSDEQQRQDIEYLFRYMGKHIKKWWD